MTTTALEALSRRPVRFLRSVWPWRGLAYLLSSAPVGALVALIAVLVQLLPVVPAVLAGLAALAAATPLVAWYERRRLPLVDAAAIPGTPDRRRRETALAVMTTLAFWWIDLVMVGFTVGGPVILILSPVVQPEPEGAVAIVASAAGFALLPVAAYTVTAWAGARAVVVRAMLAPSGSELAEVLRSRARLVDAFEVERRRIERDLHDGAQQRLVALTMTLGLARLDLPDDAPAARSIERAHAEAKQVLVELRELIRGVHSQVLTDRGLPAAIRELAGRSMIPADAQVDLEERLPAPIEIAAFYVISEALTNAAKHSNASNIAIKAEKAPQVLRLDITDDGVGGADPAHGTGLQGLADRLAVVGGRLALSSPEGGPTRMRVEIPCA